MHTSHMHLLTVICTMPDATNHAHSQPSVPRSRHFVPRAPARRSYHPPTEWGCVRREELQISRTEIGNNEYDLESIRTQHAALARHCEVLSNCDTTAEQEVICMLRQQVTSCTSLLLHGSCRLRPHTALHYLHCTTCTVADLLPAVLWW